jgi:hypothetical protein
MPLKPTPRDRRGLGGSHTTEWLKNRRQGWNDHIAALDEDRDHRQQVADTLTQGRQQRWSDFHAQEAERVATRDNYPTALDMAKETRRNNAQQAMVDGQRSQVLQARDDEQYEFQRQAQMEALAHPARLQQRRDAAEQPQQREQDQQLREAQLLDAASHPPHLQQARQQRELEAEAHPARLQNARQQRETQKTYPALAAYFTNPG